MIRVFVPKIMAWFVCPCQKLWHAKNYGMIRVSVPKIMAWLHDSNGSAKNNGNTRAYAKNYGMTQTRNWITYLWHFSDISWYFCDNLLTQTRFECIIPDSNTQLDNIFVTFSWHFVILLWHRWDLVAKTLL